jgi:hypothetical protein
MIDHTKRTYKQEKAYVHAKLGLYDALLSWCRMICHRVLEDGAVSIDDKVGAAYRTHKQDGYVYNISGTDDHMDGVHMHKVDVYFGTQGQEAYSASMSIVWQFRQDTEIAAIRADHWICDDADCDIEIVWNGQEVHVYQVNQPHLDEEAYAHESIWDPESGNTNPWREHYILDSVPDCHTSSTAMWEAYCDYFGIEDRRGEYFQMADYCEHKTPFLLGYLNDVEDWDIHFQSDDVALQSVICDAVEEWVTYSLYELPDGMHMDIRPVPYSTPYEVDLLGVDDEHTWWKKTIAYDQESTRWVLC